MKKIFGITILLFVSAMVLFPVHGEAQASIAAGNWYLQAASQATSGTSQIPQFGGSLAQTGSTISGVLHVNNSSCFDWATDVPVSGTVTGGTVTLTSDSIIGQIITITGAATSNLITGTYSIASGCAGGDYGTITAVLLSPATGNWTGAFSSNGTANTATASFSQGSPNADGYSPLSGTFTLSGPQCSFAGTLATQQSWILGNLVQAVVNVSDGSVLALNGYFIDVSTSANQMTVNFSISGGTCSGQSGSITFNRS